LGGYKPVDSVFVDVYATLIEMFFKAASGLEETIESHATQSFW
jgi:hypothetical protein